MQSSDCRESIPVRTVCNYRCLVALTVAVFANGCGSRDVASVVGAANDSNIKRVANLYQTYMSRHNYEGPKDEASFKEFIKTEMVPRKLEMMGVDPKNLDAVFVSESTGKPFLIRYGVVSGMRAPPVVVVAEDNPGPNVAWNSGKVENVDKTRLDELWGEKPVSPKVGPPEGTAPTAATSESK